MSTSSLRVVEDFSVLFDREVKGLDQKSLITAMLRGLPKEFSLKELVAMITDYFGTIFAKFVEIKVSDLYGGNIQINTNSGKIWNVFNEIISSIQKSFYNSRGVIAVTIHDLKRLSDESFLLKEISNRRSLLSGERFCEKYVAISIMSQFGSSFKARSKNKLNNNEDIVTSYYDGSIIVRTKPYSAVVYLARSVL